MLTPSEKDFELLAGRDYDIIPVCREIPGDLETPVGAFLKIGRGDYAFLLESVRGGEKWARYTFLGAEPSLVFRARGNHLEMIRPGVGVEVRSVDDPFEALRQEVKRHRAPQLDGLPRFFGGAVGFLAYDIVRYFERLPKAPPDDLGVPDLYMMFTDTVLVFDNVRQTIKIVVNVPVKDFGTARAAYRSAVEKIEETIARLATPLNQPTLNRSGPGRRTAYHFQPDPRGLHADSDGGQGVYRGRGHHPGGSVAALRGRLDRSSVQPLPQPAHD